VSIPADVPEDKHVAANSYLNGARYDMMLGSSNGRQQPVEKVVCADFALAILHPIPRGAES